MPLNLVFGVAAAWAIAKFEFRARAFLTTLVDLPFSVSPVVAGLIYVLVFSPPTAGSARMAAGARHQDHLRRARHRAGHHVRDLPFIARELIPLMQAQGTKKNRPPWCWAPAAGRPSGM